MAADKIGMRNQIGRTDRLLADAQMRNGQTACFFGVINEIPLRIPRRRVTNNLDVVLRCRDATVATQTIK
ncbi:hypothetical protein D3C87_1921980 [compost metagenome]